MTVRKIFVGIGGWNFAPWRGSFYPKGLTQARELEYANSKLTSIEINSTFYGLQKPATFEKWRDATPDGFVFSVKAPSSVRSIGSSTRPRSSTRRSWRDSSHCCQPRWTAARWDMHSRRATAPFSYLRVMGTKASAPTGYLPAALARWRERAQTLARDGDVFFYFISGAKERNPQAALEPR